MPVQHIEVNASTLKARSRVVLTEEEAQLLTRVHNADLPENTDTDSRVQTTDFVQSTDTVSRDGSTALVQNMDMDYSQQPVNIDQDHVINAAMATDAVSLANSIASSGDGNTVYLMENPSTGVLEYVKNYSAVSGKEAEPNVNTQPKMTSLLTNQILTAPLTSQIPQTKKRTQIIVSSNQPQVQSMLKQVAKERLTREVETAVKSIQPEVGSAQNPEHALKKKDPARGVKLIKKRGNANGASVSDPVLQLKSLLPSAASSSKVPGNVKVVPPVVNTGTSIPVKGMQSLLKVNQRAAPQMVLRPDTLRKLKQGGVQGIRTRHILYVVPKVTDKVTQSIIPDQSDSSQGQNGVSGSNVNALQGDCHVLRTDLAHHAKNAQNSISAAAYSLPVTAKNSDNQEFPSQTLKSTEAIFMVPGADQTSPSKYFVRNTKELSTGLQMAVVSMDTSVGSDSTVDTSAISSLTQPITTSVSGFSSDMTSSVKYTTGWCVDMETQPVSYTTEEDKSRSEEYDPFDLFKDMSCDDPINEQGLGFNSIMDQAQGGPIAGFQDPHVQLDATTSQTAGDSSSLFQNPTGMLDATASGNTDFSGLCVSGSTAGSSTSGGTQDGGSPSPSADLGPMDLD